MGQYHYITSGQQRKLTRFYCARIFAIINYCEKKYLCYWKKKSMVFYIQSDNRAVAEVK